MGSVEAESGSTYYSWIAILLTTIINDFISGFNRIQKKVLDQICQEDRESTISC